jgi:hypothetical protein
VGKAKRPKGQPGIFDGLIQCRDTGGTVEKMRQAGGGFYRVTLYGMGYLGREAQKLNTPEEKTIPPETLRTLFSLLEIAKEIQSPDGMVCACCAGRRFKDDLLAPAGYVVVEAGPMATISPVCEKCAKRPDVTTVIVERIHQDSVRVVHKEAGHA